MSAKTPLPYGVPQGSVLGSPLFLVYVSPIPSETVVEDGNVEVQQFSNDTQASVSFQIQPDQGDQKRALAILATWARKAEAWFSRNLVKLKIEKSILIYTSSKRNAPSIAPLGLRVGECTLLPSLEAKNLTPISLSSTSEPHAGVHTFTCGASAGSGVFSTPRLPNAL